MTDQGTMRQRTEHHGSEPKEPLLAVDDLSVEFFTPQGNLRVVDRVSFALAAGETYGLVGESGSGKTVTSLAAIGLIDPHVGHVPEGSVLFDGRELTGLSRRELRQIRGKDISMIFQEPRRSLDPSFTVGDQIAETLRSHLGASRREAWNRAIELLDLVRIPGARQRVREYPHQMSGGMAQRVMLAIALACSPKVLIADEPTTALDVTVQSQMLQLIRDSQAELGLAVLFISHDLGVVAEMCDRVAVMYAGQIVEQATAEDLFLRPQHPYTAALLGSIPYVHVGAGRLSAIPGSVPPPHAWPKGCRFNPRCPHAVEACRSGEVALKEHDGHGARCVRVAELALEGVHE